MPRARKYLLPVDVPVPLRAAAHGARAQLHDRRRAGALHAHAGQQRAAADGLGCLRPAGRERRDRQRRAAGEVDAREHRLHEQAAAVARASRIDWERELATCDPSYYRWNQWLFLRMLEKGIAYRKTGVVNWDPVDQTVLANEQVIDGRGWRTGALVEKREIPMYYLQHHALRRRAARGARRPAAAGPSACARCRPTGSAAARAARSAFPYAPDTRAALGAEGALRVFTTRADTLFGVTFMAVAAEHPLALAAARGDARLAAFVEECRRGSVMEADVATAGEEGHADRAARAASAHRRAARRSGSPTTCSWATARAPSWACRRTMSATSSSRARYDLADRARGALAHGRLRAKCGAPWQRGLRRARRDGEFRRVLADSTFEAAVDAIAAALERKGLGEKRVQWRLRDWGISRQRYWGCPIPIIHCATCGEVPVPDEDLPVRAAGGPGAGWQRQSAREIRGLLRVPLPAVRRPARRETDTMDTFVDSSWYFLRYACSDDTERDGR